MWASPLDEPRKIKAQEVIRSLVQSCTDQNIVKSIIKSSDSPLVLKVNQRSHVGLMYALGVAHELMPDSNLDYVSHAHLQEAFQLTRRSSSIALHGGLAGLGLHCSLVKQGQAYKQLLSAIDQTVSEHIVVLLRQLSSSERGLSPSHYDLISGLTGVGAYLLERVQSGRDSDALSAILLWLCTRTNSKDDLMGFYTPRSMLPIQDKSKRAYKNGLINLGLSHGLPGLLMLLSLAWQNGIKCSGMQEAIERISQFIIMNRLETTTAGLNWPVACTFDGSIVRNATSTERCHRAAWCYGAPGVARALYLSGVALNRDDNKRVALQAVSRAGTDWEASTPTFCHGVAGLLQIMLRFFNETGSAEHQAQCLDLFDKIVDQYDSLADLKFWKLGTNGDDTTDLSLMTGVSGILLVLIASINPVAPKWDRIALLS